MATSARKLDRAGIEAEVFDIARHLLTELGSRHGVDAIRGSAHLDRDLGLGSLERVELFVRLDRAFGSHLPERVVAEADTLDDVIASLTTATGASTESQSNRRTSARDAMPSSGAQAGAPAPAWADTWQDVIRYRAAEDAVRPHLILWDDAGEAQRVSFGELHDGARRVAAELARRGVGRGDAVALMLPTVARIFSDVCRRAAGGRRPGADLSAGARRPHRGIRRAAIGHPAQR